MTSWSCPCSSSCRWGELMLQALLAGQRQASWSAGFRRSWSAWHCWTWPACCKVWGLLCLPEVMMAQPVITVLCWPAHFIAASPACRWQSMTSQRAGCQTTPLAVTWMSSKPSCATKQGAMSTVSSVPRFTMHLHHRLHLHPWQAVQMQKCRCNLVASASP